MNIVITGATKGIGRAIAEEFASHDFDIAFCARNPADLASMQADLQNRFPNNQFIYQVADVSKKEQVEQFGDFVLQHFEEVNLLVNNAGVFLPGQVINEPAGNLEQLIETNLYSAYYLTRKLTPQMIRKRFGHIFNICSTASIKAYPNGGSYSISKFALLGFSKALREELTEHNVRVTSVIPGATFTASWAGSELPESRFMAADDIAKAIYGVFNLSTQTVVEEIVLRPQLGDI